jgi:muconolactone delta-isomerase
MEYLVTMTTHVPDGTPEQAVQDVRTREAGHSAELAAQGHLLRLWRPPLQPGEWRTLGLFAAAGDQRLEDVLASMPLRVWRTDEVTPLAPHPNDPHPNDPHPNDPAPASGPAPAGPGADGKGPEFLVTVTVTVPPGTAAQTVADTDAEEAQRAHDLAAQGHLIRLWTLPGAGRALGLWRARDAGQLEEILSSLPVAPWTAVDVTPLSPHPSDPAILRPPAVA